MTLIRWQLNDLVANQTYTLPCNPSAMTSPSIAHATTSFRRSPIDGVVRVFRPGDKPRQWSFTGRLRTQSEYDAFVDWCNRPNRIQLTDHLGRVHSVLLQDFAPQPIERSGRKDTPWLFAYTVTAIYYGRIS
jgi:hypothetical protein